MLLEDLDSQRFDTETGIVVTVQVPAENTPEVLDAVLEIDDLVWGDYDRVAFTSPPGNQQFRSLPGGRNRVTEETMRVPCVELSFYLSGDSSRLARVLEAVYDVHPYEEPVIFVRETLRTLHIRGLDEDNPNRFWNREAADWVPEVHR